MRIKGKTRFIHTFLKKELFIQSPQMTAQVWNRVLGKITQLDLNMVNVFRTHAAISTLSVVTCK